MFSIKDFQLRSGFYQLRFCLFQCFNGNCVGIDSCANVMCTTPPSQCHNSTGICDDTGTCQYFLKDPGSPCDDGMKNMLQVLITSSIFLFPGIDQ